MLTLSPRLRTWSSEIDRFRKEHPHPVYQFVGSATEFTYGVRFPSGGHKWITSPAAASVPCGTLIPLRIGTNLYCHARDLSYGAPIDIDGASHARLTVEQLAEIEARRPAYVNVSVRSTSGTGRHWFVIWSRPIPATPQQHRQLGKRAALKLAHDVGLSYQWIDTSTNLLWTYAADAGEGAFQ